MNKVILCGRSSCHGCPTVEVDEVVVIRNDYGESVTLQLPEWRILKNKIKAGEFDG
jgi:hypothetical protein